MIFRHRFKSVKIREGVPITNIAAYVGHKPEVADTRYLAHVLIDE
jgi:hypothetical protein